MSYHPYSSGSCSGGAFGGGRGDRRLAHSPLPCTPLRSAELGHRTLVLSTDLAHSLGDSLDVALGPQPKPLAPLLWAQEPDVALYDVIIVDAAPTGERLRLLSLPEALHWWIEQVFPLCRRGMKVARRSFAL